MFLRFFVYFKLSIIYKSSFCKYFDIAIFLTLYFKRKLNLNFMSQTYEVEIKSLLINEENVENLKQKIQKLDPNSKHISSGKQLNHYFNSDGSFLTLTQKLEQSLSSDEAAAILDLGKKVKEFSLRAREINGNVVKLIIKATVDNTNSSNGLARQELELKLPLTLDNLDSLILESGFTFQAKWSRERQEYSFKDLTVCIDKNAGYGYLAEFEKLTENKDEIENIKKEIYSAMKALEAPELKQDRLNRMFQFYNQHWQDYYGTDKVFEIE